jgi:hypothetical protein
MAGWHLRTLVQGVLGLTLSLAATGAGLWADQPSAKQEAKSDTSQQPQRQKEQAARTEFGLCRYERSPGLGTGHRKGSVEAQDAGAAVYGFR